ncbi:Ig-like domain-containing protein [Schaalia canis]|uniref:Fibronectin type III domain-containing protein n=1 Tax=Schaalia canis TaxID=100469 RepID=A0A3P1SEA7_9ACTO|nr:Ig-like domain-containing protein [Schaalia canis]RRC95364.1 fibronectin type III domain-containing protein [Schaalia canis]
MARSSRVRKVAGVSATVGAVTSLVVALLNPGVHTTEVDLNDGGVWVTNANLRLVAHLNYPARLLDTGLRAASAVFNVFQNGEQVLLSDGEASTLTGIDVSNAALTTPVEYAGMATTAGGPTVAITDGVSGKVWIQDAAAPASFLPEETDPDVTEMPGALTAVGLDGSVHVASSAGSKLVSVIPKGQVKETVEHDLSGSGINGDSTLQVAAVGSTPVVLDRNTSTLIFADGKTQVLEGKNLTLQESGPQAESVLVASDAALLEVPMGGGTVTTYPAMEQAGNPSRPVRHQSCMYGAWAGTGAFLRQCAVEEDTVALTVDTMKSAEQAVFRVNRDVIVLNDVKSGGLWLPDENMLLVDNWDQIESTIESEDDTEEESPDETEQTLLPERSEQNTPPVAVDDEFGVRAGRTAILPVLQNDSDIDGDFLTAIAVSQPSIGEVVSARDGSVLQIHVAPDASGAASFEYEVSDGRGGTAKARVTLSVHGDDVNSPPTQTIVPTISLGTGRKATINALANWVDPDGDPFYLESATAPAGISVRTHVNGSVDVAEIGHGPGKDQVTLFVSDGRDTGEGQIVVNVKESGNEAPVANADHVIVRQGSSTSFSPLTNDTDPNGDPLRLVQIENSPAGVTATMDGAAGTISIQGNAVGTYYLGYVITDGPATGPGVIRIDVIDAATEAPPSAEPDLGVLPEGGQVLVDLLANDSDPTGGVLTVQKLDVPATSPLVVALINNQMVRVTAPRGLNGPETFSYTVSNGVASATATVTVLPKPAQTGNEPPELNDDQIIVRAGDVASVAVLANDRSPAGLKLTVSNDLQHEIKPDLGTVFISDNVIRVRGGERGGSGKIVYTVHDAMGNVASAVVNLVVVAMDADTNTAPRPKDLTARTIAGREVDILVPLDNIDPEGDSVSLVGLASAPKLGTVTQEGTLLRYTAAEDAKGTDSFTYLVEDRLGKQASATVRVGVAPRAGTNQNPVALPDQVQVRPKTKVAVAVLSNDIDPDGDDVVLEKDSLSSQTAGLDLSERSGRVVVVAPEAEGSHVISYAVSDRKGGSAQGILTVIVKNEAPELAPIARDDSVTSEDLQTAENNAVTVPVLVNDEDPDGDIADATISSSDANVRVNTDGTVSVSLTPEAQILIYTVTDPTGKKASAVIRVPGTDITRPTVDTTSVPIKVKAGQKKEIPINDHIIARDGRSVLITSNDKVSAGLGTNGDPLVKDAKTLVFTAKEDFSGLTSITLEVTDGKDLNDSEGRTAVVTLPIEVEPADNRPPTFTPTAVEVAPGEEAAVADLALMVTDPDKDDPASMSYTIVGNAPAGLSASVSGTKLSVSAPADAQRGSAGSLRISVDDRRGGTTEADVPVTIVSSSRPLIQTSEAQVTLDAGKSTTVDVTQYATNPFQDQGAITLVGAPSAGEGGAVTANGTQLSISANTGFNGTFTVSYTVVDVTKDPSREVRGIVTATVRDKPGAPTNASVVSNSSGTAQVSWTAGPANGTPITGFTVTDHTQGDTQECGLVTTCLIPNRKNGVEHTFSVTATNEVGVSEASNQATTMIDIEPEAPAAPTLKAGDRELTVSWQPPHNEGSALIDYEVTLSPAGTQTVSASNQSVTFTGLTNGAEYVATVTARNGKGSSPASQASPAMVPYGAPGPVGSLAASYGGLGSGTGQVASVDVSWTRPANINGREIEYYTVSAGGVTKTVQAPATSTSLEGVGFNAEQVQFTVTATNDGANAVARTSEAANVSTWVVGQPLPPSIASVRATGENNQVRIEYSGSPAGQGWSPGQLRYEWSAGGGWAPLDGSVLSGNGLSNGQATTVRIRAVGEKTGSAVYSTEVASASVSPFGPPSNPQVSCWAGGVGWVDCTWKGSTNGGRGTQLVLSGSASETIAHSAEGHRPFNVGEGNRGQLCVQAVQTSDELGRRTSETVCAEANARSYGRYYSVDRFGGTHNISGYVPNCGAGCQWVRIRLEDWPPHSQVKCWTTGAWSKNLGDDDEIITVDSNGFYHSIPPFFGAGIFAAADRYLVNVHCEGNRR